MSDIDIIRLGHRGDGIGRDDQGAEHFVPFTLPGEKVRVDPLTISNPNPARVPPVCPHFTTCGGCAVQHASDAFVADWKVEIVRTALSAQGLPAPIEAVHSSPAQSRRRATFSGRRTKKSASIGFHARGSDQIVPIQTCEVVAPELMASLPALTELVRIVGSRKGELRLTVTHSDAGLDVAVEDGKEITPELSQDLLAVAQAHDFARLSWSGDVLATFRPPAQSFGPARVMPPPGAFLQATPQGEAALVRAVMAAVGDAGRIVDLFAGCGTFTLPLATQADVLALESEAAMLTALDAGWRAAPGLRKIATKARDLFRQPVPGVTLKPFEAAVIDPPRAGALAQTEALAEAQVARIAAVSCNPVTFARDAAVLIKAGYTLNRIDVIDQFRWSPHVELVGAFSR